MSGMGGGLSKFAPAYLRNRYRVLFYTTLSVLGAIPIAEMDDDIVALLTLDADAR